MDSSVDRRTCEQIAIGHRVKVVPKGGLAVCAPALNISLGGLLLGAAPVLPVGTSCEVSLLLPGAPLSQAIRAAGTVVRSDAHGTAIRFAEDLQPEVLQSVLRAPGAWQALPLLRAYVDYFQASRSQDPTDCQALLGVSKGTLQTVFFTTLTTAILVAILLVWGYRAAVPAIPIWEKAALVGAYGALWMGLIQPSADLLILTFLRSRKPVPSASRTMDDESESGAASGAT